MSGENTQTNNEQTLSTNDSTHAVDKNVPYDRFSEVNTQKNDAVKQVESLQSQLDKMNQANKSREEEELAKQGEYKQLLDNTKKDLEGFKTKADQWDSYQTNRRTSLMEKLSNDTSKSIAEGLSLDKLEMYVDNEVAKINAPSTSTARAANGKTDDFGGFETLEEFAMANPLEAEKYLQRTTKGYIK
tara:strand:+ start:1159 stop:1719 length:561 start_codon:yes stop_codon:yes gene_type:complete